MHVIERSWVITGISHEWLFRVITMRVGARMSKPTVGHLR